MKTKLRRLGVPAVLITMTGVILAGCGGDNGTTSQTEAAGGGSAGHNTLEIKLGDFFFKPKNATAKAGPTVIKAPNDGSVEHELVLFKTNMNPAKLPTKANGGVDEEKLEKTTEEGGEIPDVEAGQTESGNFKLTPGKYVMFCNLPGHYAQGMYGTLTVTK